MDKNVDLIMINQHCWVSWEISLYDLGYLKYLFHSIRLLGTMVFQYGVLKAVVSLIQKTKKNGSFLWGPLHAFCKLQIVDH